jgi:hypothetical protein
MLDVLPSKASFGIIIDHSRRPPISPSPEWKALLRLRGLELPTAVQY